MSEPPDQLTEQPPENSRADNSRRTWLRTLGVVVGIALLAAAVVFVLRERATVENAVASVRDSSPLLIGIVLVSVLANIGLTALLVRHLLSRFGTVGLREMYALVCASALFNYLPMRPGLIGRLGYHKKYNNIPLRDSFRTMLEAVGLSGLCTAWILIAAALSLWHDSLFFIALGLMLVFLPIVMIAARGAFQFWARAALYRYIDLLITMVRYSIVFGLIGYPIAPPVAAILAGISITATLIPFLSNGLGLREWLVGLFAPLLDSGDALNQTIAMTADLVNRSVEVVVVLIAGLIGFVWIMRRVSTTDAPPRSPSLRSGRG